MINGKWDECLEDGYICLDEKVFGLLFDGDRIAVLKENQVIGELIDQEDDDSYLIKNKWHIFVEIFDPSSDCEHAEHERERVKKEKPPKKKKERKSAESDSTNTVSISE